jgi:hypothetical protein
MALKVKAVERLLKFDKESAGLVFRKKKKKLLVPSEIIV